MSFGSRWIWASRIPSVTTLNRVPGELFVGETHLIADLVTELHAHLRGDAFGHRACGDTARLGVHDLLAVRATAKLKQDFRQLCGFAEPVWPDTITTWKRLTALAISSRAADTGSSAGYSYFMTNFNDTEALGARVFARSEPLASASSSQGISESEPRFFCTTR